VPAHRLTPGPFRDDSVRRHGVEDDLTDDGERRDDEEAGECGQAKEPPVVHPRGGRPAERLDDDGRQDDLAQSALVEQTTPPGAGDRDGHGGRGREQAGCSVAAVEGVHDVKMRITPPENMGIRMKSPSSNPVRAAGRARTGR